MRSRLRTLHVDEREYTWKADVTSAPAGDGKRRRVIRVRVWGGGKNSTAIQVDLTHRPQQAEQYPYPAADDVRAVIAGALAAGWTPEAVGGTFQITTGHSLELAGFAVTDMLWVSEVRRSR